MSEPENPFNPSPNGSLTVSKSVAVAWFVAVLMTCIALFLLMVWLQNKTNQEQKLTALRASLDKTASQLSDALNQDRTNQDFIASLQQQITSLETEKEQAAHMSKGLEDEMRSALESKDVTISNLQGRLTVNITGPGHV